MRRRDGRPLDIPLAPFGNLQLDSGSAIPSWGGPLPIPITNLDRRRYAWPLRACLRGSLKPSLRPLLWQVALETWTSSSTLESLGLVAFQPTTTLSCYSSPVIRERCVCWVASPSELWLKSSAKLGSNGDGI